MSEVQGGVVTREQIEQIVSEWQIALGLQLWDLKVDWNKPCEEDADASTWRSNQYERATMHFPESIEGLDLATANRLVVHELLHLHTRGIDELLKDTYDQMHRDASSQVERRYEKEIEGVVDRLAYRLVEIGGCVGEADDESTEGPTEVEVRWD